jgi:hypothetical protein
MTIHTLHPHLTNGKRPTISSPVLKNDAVAGALAELDAHICLLQCAADSAALEEQEGGRGQLTETLYFLHSRFRRECDKLYSLL